ncbi:hypothetical protein [Thalassospira xiamenensis]|uniref:Uncharacterized protein n=1 Tax=Thalassospira xiamenensis TaxID=220697 RepID=A0A285TXM4_9PROT|nr:hypothetical protein [Thalassospira xiamenensis]SOC30565.1 hypothetical protein SAMN05428964_109113 [Thalassospira xiamenensis]
MTTWPKLTEEVPVDNDLIVELLDTEEKLTMMGKLLENGLSVHADVYVPQCIRGEKQIFQLLDGATRNVVACGELKVVGDQVKSMFVRGYRNQEFTEGSEYHDAVMEYLRKVNSREVPLITDEIADGLFKQSSPSVTNEWQVAVATASEKGVSPFAALIAGNPEPILAAEYGKDDVENVTWPMIAPRFTAENGYVLEHVTSSNELRTIGERLEGSMIVAWKRAALKSKEGEVAYVSVARPGQDGDLIAFAELQVHPRSRVDRDNQQVFVTGIFGEFDAKVTPDISDVVSEFVKQLPHSLTVALEPGRFALPRPPLDEHGTEYLTPMFLFNEYGEPHLTCHIVRSQPEDPYLTTFDAAVEIISWDGLTEPYSAPNGWSVVPVTSGDQFEALEKAGARGLSHMLGIQCFNGDLQIVMLVDEKGEARSTAFVRSEQGQLISWRHNAFSGRTDVSDEERAALSNWIEAVHSKQIDVALALGEGSFEPVGPALKM